MPWDDEDDGDAVQMLKNQAFLRMPLTNRTRDDAMPGIGCLVLLFFLAALALGWFARDPAEEGASPGVANTAAPNATTGTTDRVAP